MGTKLWKVVAVIVALSAAPAWAGVAEGSGDSGWDARAALRRARENAEDAQENPIGPLACPAISQTFFCSYDCPDFLNRGQCGTGLLTIRHFSADSLHHYAISLRRFAGTDFAVDGRRRLRTGGAGGEFYVGTCSDGATLSLRIERPYAPIGSNDGVRGLWIEEQSFKSNGDGTLLLFGRWHLGAGGSVHDLPIELCRPVQ